MNLSSDSIPAGGRIPDRYSAYHDGISPSLRWEPVQGARAYALIVDDPDAPRAEPFVHWLAWNIPADVSALPEGVPPQARLADPGGVVQGRSDAGEVGYFGPRPPAGDPPHHYRFRLLALDSELSVPPGADHDQLQQALDGHVIDRGELVATYQRQ